MIAHLICQKASLKASKHPHSRRSSSIFLEDFSQSGKRAFQSFVHKTQNIILTKISILEDLFYSRRTFRNLGKKFSWYNFDEDPHSRTSSSFYWRTLPNPGKDFSNCLFSLKNWKRPTNTKFKVIQEPRELFQPKRIFNLSKKIFLRYFDDLI